MNQKDVYRVFAQKLGVKQMSLQDSKLSDGKIFIEYFKQVFRYINKEILGNRHNHNPTEEFSNKSVSPWSYLNPDACLLDFARLLAIPASRSAANIRAQCTKPRVTKDFLKCFLATQLEKDIKEIDLKMKVREIRLPVANYNKHSWVTFIRWCETIGFKGHPENLDDLADITVDELFDFWTS